MDENVVFQNKQVNQNNQNPTSNTANDSNQPPDQGNYHEESESSGSTFFSRLLKALIGLFVLATIGFAIFYFVIPRIGRNNDQKVTLTYWGLWEDSRMMKPIISDFEKQNPNIKVEYSKQDVKQYRERLITRIKDGSGPDIFRFHNTWVIQLSDVLLPFSSDTIQKDNFQKWYYPVAQQDLIKNGAIYGIPLSIDTLSLFINEEIFKTAGLQPPKTWEEFAKTARELTVKDESGKIKTAGAALGTFDNITHAPDIVSLFLVQNGADLKDLSNTSKNASDALDFYVSFAKEEGNIWDETLDPSILAFSKGNLAMYFGYSWDVFIIKAYNPQLIFNIVPIPHLPGRNMTIASYWAEGVSVKSKHQKEAMLFMKFLINKETQQKLFSEEAKTRLFGEPYSRTDLANTLKDNPLVYPFIEQAKDAVSSFFASDTYDNGLNFQVNNYLGNAIRSIFVDTSPQSAVETLSQGVSQVLQQYNSQKPTP